MSNEDDINEFYDGSDLLRPISHATGLSIDKVNFLSCQLIALLFGFPYRTILSAHRVSSNVRHAVQVLIGVLLMVFCFGRQVKHILIQTAVCLAMMRLLKPGIMEKGVFVVAMGYLCVTHIYRMVYDYGGYTLDITGPLMISTQRLTSLAYNISDGREKDQSKLSVNTRKLSVRDFPSLLEFSSYIFCFHGLMCGPFCFYKDFLAFIDGSSYSSITNTNEAAGLDDNSGCHRDVVKRTALPPDPTRALISKSISALACGLISAIIVPFFLVTSITETHFENGSFVYKMFYLIVSTSLHRQKYYFAWKLAELVNINAGLGFNGLNDRGQPSWNLIDNTDIYEVETATSLKVLLDNWNKMTTYWLRLVVYDRYHSTLAVFLFSAFWHGFYIGYYLTFIGGGLFIHAARLVRRKVRPFFQTSVIKARLYDVLTFVATRFSIAYLTFPFVLLELLPAIAIYKQLYFWLHIATSITAVALMIVPTPRSATSKSATIKPESAVSSKED